jgi:hypothetical protein
VGALRGGSAAEGPPSASTVVVRKDRVEPLVDVQLGPAFRDRYRDCVPVGVDRIAPGVLALRFGPPKLRWWERVLVWLGLRKPPPPPPWLAAMAESPAFQREAAELYAAGEPLPPYVREVRLRRPKESP